MTTTEQLRQERVRLLKRQQILDKDTVMRQINWRDYVSTREAYFMSVARDNGMAYTPIPEQVSGVELCKSERQTKRQSQTQ